MAILRTNHSIVGINKDGIEMTKISITKRLFVAKKAVHYLLLFFFIFARHDILTSAIPIIFLYPRSTTSIHSSEMTNYI